MQITQTRFLNLRQITIMSNLVLRIACTRILNMYQLSKRNVMDFSTSRKFKYDINWFAGLHEHLETLHVLI